MDKNETAEFSPIQSKGKNDKTFFSERNGLIQTNNEYSPEFRRAIVTSFFNQYSMIEEIFFNLRDVMDIFGIEQPPMLTDDATLKINKENTLAYFQKCPWNHLFDFVEKVLEQDPYIADALTEKYNQIFRLHGCKYRVFKDKVIPVVNDLEIQEMSKALNTGVEGTDHAYNEAIVLLSARPEPDYNAVIAKASNALESMVLAIAKDHDVSQDTLGKAINALKGKGIALDCRMENLIKSTYSYACTAGIRHGGTTPIVAKEADAIYILVLSAAEINYLNAQRLAQK